MRKTPDLPMQPCKLKPAQSLLSPAYGPARILWAPRINWMRPVRKRTLPPHKPPPNCRPTQPQDDSPCLHAQSQSRQKEPRDGVPRGRFHEPAHATHADGRRPCRRRSEEGELVFSIPEFIRTGAVKVPRPFPLPCGADAVSASVREGVEQLRALIEETAPSDDSYL